MTSLGTRRANFSDELDHVSEFCFRVCPYTGFDKRSAVLGTGLVNNGKDGRTTGLLDLCDLTFDGNGLSQFLRKIDNSYGSGFPIDVLYLVHLVLHLFEIDISVWPYFADFNKDRIALLVFCLDIALVHKSLDPIV